ncbi:hypothetical protein C499_11821 [Halogeometricum borinquense DSM 11551]|uniref:Uncharacterized protein n=2 Tax=Halogeometricum borinquense TaxID=60847 RepID=L9URT5_HALBP|nr:hypothetical protein [Halogeometricum borinquense]ELY26893.1 hypothetical protein C499_11821 [Halogeometricum borinquense DSM 11551]RYJ14214.1 hypothetical protein ELS19_09735 [Halogeometricum borinquense]
MVSQAYQLGLLLVVFGGFLATNSTGSVSGIGILSMYLGLLVGITGCLQSGIRDRRTHVDPGSARTEK